MWWKNANHSLLDNIFCCKLCKCTRVPDCLLSSREQFLALIPWYISSTYTANGFKILLGRVNFMSVLSLPLYVSLTLIAVMTDIVSIIQRASFGGVDSQVLVTSIKKLQKWCFVFCLRVKCFFSEWISDDVLLAFKDLSNKIWLCLEKKIFPYQPAVTRHSICIWRDISSLSPSPLLPCFLTP